jgi:hypothetical protein
MKSKTSTKINNNKARRKGIHAKTKNSWNTNSKNYRKRYNRQGRV